MKALSSPDVLNAIVPLLCEKITESLTEIAKSSVKTHVDSEITLREM